MFGSPHRSAKKRAAALHLSHSSVGRILHIDLNFHPYKMVVVQQLSDLDEENCMIFSENFLNILTRDEVILLSDEAHFHLLGTVNKQNFCYWAESNPQQLHLRPVHGPQVTVRCRVASFGIVGPYFFEEGGSAVIVTSAQYVKMLRNFLAFELHRRELGLRTLWFQQVGETAHTAST